MSSDEIAGACLFKFLSDNTLVESAIITTLKPMAIVFTDHSVKSIDVLKKAKQVEETGETLTKLIHSHPGNTAPSGYLRDLGNKGDKATANVFVKSNNYLIEHYVYSPKYNILAQYNKDKIIGVMYCYLIFNK